MRIVVIGDIHGNSKWQDIVNKEVFDKVVFVGDYFDSHENVSPIEQIHNFKNILAFKKANAEKTVLLIGNHDYHYLPGVTETYSGFQQWHKWDIQEVLKEALSQELLQMCFIHNNILITHAGVTNTWLASVGYTKHQLIDVFINDLFKYKQQAFAFTIGPKRSQYGDDQTQTPIWVRPGSLSNDKVKGFIQIVGHTIQDKLCITKHVIKIDTLNTSQEYLIIKDDVFSIGKI